MAQFEVIGTDSKGSKKKVFVEADSPKTARLKVKRDFGLIPIQVTNADPAAIERAKNASFSKQLSSIGSNISFQTITEMTRQLASLVKAHVPVVESLSAIYEQSEDQKLKNIIGQIRQNVKEGKPLGDSFEMFPRVFNRVYINMVRAGESSGKLDVVLMRLADFSEGQVKLRGKIQGAMLYPIIMSVVGTLVIGVIFVKVVPQITQIFSDMKATLPIATQILIAVADFMQSYALLLLVAIVALIVFLRFHVGTEKGRAQFDRLKLRTPAVNKLVKTIVIARFARTLGTMLQSGVPMLAALNITKNVVGCVPFEVALEQAGTQVSEGRSLNASLRQSGLFPPIVIHMVGVGEKTGELENMLMSVAESYEEQVDRTLNTLTGLLGPVMIIFLAGAVGFIVMATLQPIFQMNQFR